MKKLAIFSMHPAQYRDPVFKELVKRKNLNVKIYSYYHIPGTHLEWEEKEVEYLNIYLDKRVRIPVFGNFHTEIFKILKKEKFDVIMIMGYYPLTSLLLILWCQIRQIPYIYSADTVNFEEKKNFNIVKKGLIKKAAAVWVTGNASGNYMRKNGIPKEKIVKGAYTLDIVKLVNDYRDSRKNMEKAKNAVSIKKKEKVILFVGKLIPDRNISLLLNAFINISQKHDDLKLIIIGDGPQSDVVEEFKRQNIQNIIHIEGVPYDELHRYYEAADCYVHPGTEPYSLAVAEAAIAGIPVIATKKVGAVYDYVKDGGNGYRIHGDSVEELAECLEKALYEVDWKDRNMEKFQKKFIEELAPHQVAENLVKKIEEII